MAPEEIITKFTYQSGSIDCLLFEPSKVNKIVASFTGMNSGKYDRWSWYYEWFNRDSDDTLYITFRDEEHLFYLNRSRCNYQEEVINFLSSLLVKHNINADNLITVGSSMGGYAALYYGFSLGAKLSIASVPLVDITSARLHPYTLWTRKMEEIGESWIDLDEFLSDFSNSPEVFLIHGKYPADLESSDKLVKVFNLIGCKYKREILDEDTHEEFLTKSKMMELIRNGIF